MTWSQWLWWKGVVCWIGWTAWLVYWGDERKRNQLVLYWNSIKNNQCASCAHYIMNRLYVWVILYLSVSEHMCFAFTVWRVLTWHFHQWKVLNGPFRTCRFLFAICKVCLLKKNNILPVDDLGVALWRKVGIWLLPSQEVVHLVMHLSVLHTQEFRGHQQTAVASFLSCLLPLCRNQSGWDLFSFSCPSLSLNPDLSF